MSASPRAYPATSDEQLHEIPSDVVVRRLPCLDAARHFAVSGAYPDFLAWPDRWVTWLPSLIAAGLAECLMWKPDVIWSTFPIPTAVLAGGLLARLSGKPWIVDLRDSMTEDNYPPDRRLRRLLRRIESMAVTRARAVTFTSPGAERMYAGRFPQLSADRWVQMPNGYDEESFRTAERIPSSRPSPRRDDIVLLHSGLLDPVDRNPRAFFRALATLRQVRKYGPRRLRIVLRATGHDELYRTMIEEMRIGDIVELAPPLPYVRALREMLDVDGLLVFQASNCNHQTPAKLYEYLRAHKPILGMTDCKGDTAAVMRAAGCLADQIASIDDAEEIEERLSQFVEAVQYGHAAAPALAQTSQWSRSAQSAALARLLERVARSA